MSIIDDFQKHGAWNQNFGVDKIVSKLYHSYLIC